MAHSSPSADSIDPVSFDFATGIVGSAAAVDLVAVLVRKFVVAVVGFFDLWIAGLAAAASFETGRSFGSAPRRSETFAGRLQFRLQLCHRDRRCIPARRDERNRWLFQPPRESTRSAN